MVEGEGGGVDGEWAAKDVGEVGGGGVRRWWREWQWCWEGQWRNEE